MKYLVNPNNRPKTLNDVCMPQYLCPGLDCHPLDLCPEKCTSKCNTRCNPRCETYCRIDGCYCKVGNGRNEINSTGSFM